MVKKTASEPITEEPYKPMAVQPVTDKDRLEAMEARIEALESQVNRHLGYHFGKAV